MLNESWIDIESYIKVENRITLIIMPIYTRLNLWLKWNILIRVDSTETIHKFETIDTYST